MNDKICVLVDSKQYAFNEIYQQHLHSLLIDDCSIRYVELNEILSSSILRRLNRLDVDRVFSALRLRTLKSNVNAVSKFVGDLPVVVQDYDPWVSYMDGSPHKGAYDLIASKLNVKKFLVSSTAWAEFIIRQGLPAEGIQLGVPSKQCAWKKWEDRRFFEPEFRGSMYDSRLMVHRELEKFGLSVYKEPIKPYEKFLEHLLDVRIWVDPEPLNVLVDGIEVEYNALCPKALEILSRGCFLIRNKDTEAKHYGLDKMPTAFLCSSLSDYPLAVKEIEKLDLERKNNMIEETVEHIKEQNYYQKIVRKIYEA